MLGSESIPAAVPQATLVALRQATASRHARIESLVGLSGPFSLAHYGRVLQGFHAFVRCWEPRVAQALPRHLRPWFSRARRLEWLQRDLAVLQLDPLAEDVPLPPLDTPAQALGSLYVLEGAALGGQVITAQVRHRLGLDAGRGADFFHGFGPGTALRWREFRLHLAEALDPLPASRQRAVQGAVDTFDSLIALFQQLLHERAAA